MKGKVLKNIVVGLGIGILLSGLMYAGLTLLYKDAPALGENVAKTEENTLDDSSDNTSTDIEKKQPVLNSNVEHVAAMTAADTLTPKNVEKMYVIAPPNSQVKNVQGGCAVGDYFYQAFYFADVAENQANNECIIVKCELETGKVIKQSEVLQLNHVNDIAYNEKLECLVVAHNAPLSNLISYVNIETLEVVETFPIDYYIYSIAYNAARDQYVIGIQESQNFRILDAEFNPVGDLIKSSVRSKSSTTQGSDCDDDFIYFTLYEPNVVTVYDWDGNFVTLIELDDYIASSDFEPEDLTVIDGAMYINCGINKATLFKVSDFAIKSVKEGK